MPTLKQQTRHTPKVLDNTCAHYDEGSANRLAPEIQPDPEFHLTPTEVSGNWSGIKAEEVDMGSESASRADPLDKGYQAKPEDYDHGHGEEAREGEEICNSSRPMPSRADWIQGQDGEGDLPSDLTDQADQLLLENGSEFMSDGFSDGYDSDSYSSASTSIGSSVRDFAYENGWRYHRFREGAYNFPNDDVEQEREDMKHAMVKLLCGQKLHFAPIGDNPQEILDIGTGTGIWSIEMGDLYPSARVLGIDLSPIQPEWLPPNVRFVVDDAESTWLYPENHFDYIHARHVVMGIRDWPKMFSQALQHLKPGGWIEVQEVHHYPQSALPDSEMPKEHPVAKFWEYVSRGLAVLGVNLNLVADGNLVTMLQEAGFTNITDRVLHIPLGTWPKGRHNKAVGLYWRTILLDGLQAISLGPFMRGLHWSRDEVELFLMDVRRAYYDDSVLMFMPFHFIQAQKPLQPF